MKNIFFVFAFLLITSLSFSQGTTPLKGNNLIKVELPESSIEDMVDQIVQILLKNHIAPEVINKEYGFVKTGDIFNNYNTHRIEIIINNNLVYIKGSVDFSGTESEVFFVTAKSHVAYRPFQKMMKLANDLGGTVTYYEVEL